MLDRRCVIGLHSDLTQEFSQYIGRCCRFNGSLIRFRMNWLNESFHVSFDQSARYLLSPVTILFLSFLGDVWRELRRLGTYSGSCHRDQL
jgi:hypothetical protein